MKKRFLTSMKVLFTVCQRTLSKLYKFDFLVQITLLPSQKKVN
jgi:hypothetical protein